MIETNQTLYVPALRLKAGELLGIRNLASDIASAIIPRMIIPPRNERDNELQYKLFPTEVFPDVSDALSKHWSGRNVLLDSTYLFDEFGRDRIGHWLPRMFERARNARSFPIPLFSISDLLECEPTAIRASLDTGLKCKLGITFSSGGLADNDLVKRALELIGKLNLKPEDCLVIADFYDADFSEPSIVAPIISGVLDDLQSAAQWQHIVFQGTNFPAKNPAEPNSDALVPRNEWLAWRNAIKFDPQTAHYMIFGDYAADCAIMNFEKTGGAIAIRHHRYTTPDAWFVPRGGQNGRHETVMRDVCNRILDSGKFAGRTFSTADDQIYRIAKGNGKSGIARDWRATNTTHHITQVVTDIGAIRGIQFGKKLVEPLSEQMMLADF